jgi:hypothetical protein
MLYTKIYHSRQKTLNSGSDLQNEFYRILEKQEIKSVENGGLQAQEAGCGQPERRVDHPLLVYVLISVAYNGFLPLNFFYLKVLFPRAHIFCRRV